MPLKDTNFWTSISQYVHHALFVLLAAIAAFVHQLMTDIENDVKVSFPKLLIQSVAAGLVGLLVTLLCHACSFSEELTGVAVGLSGWLGADATMGAIKKIVDDRLRIKTDTTKDTTDYGNPPTPSAVSDVKKESN